jgi:hypothetical protein
MTHITNHAKERLAERVCASAQEAAQKNADRAYLLGIQYDETTGILRTWLTSKIWGNRAAKNFRIFRNYLYIFWADTLVTVFPLPEEIADILQNDMDPAAYKRILDYETQRSHAKRNRAQKKYRERKAEFDRLVLLNDIREFSENLYDVEFTSVKIEKKLLTIYYIPRTRCIPSLDLIADHMRECTKYTHIRFVHVKGIKGEKIYGARRGATYI